MKSLLPLLICASFVPGWRVAQEATPRKLPPAIASALDKRFPGWQLLEVRDEIRNFVKEYFPGGAQPEFTSGDFDGNGEQDYAVLIEHGTTYDRGRKLIGRNVNLVAFLKKGRKYKFHIVDPEGGGEYLFMARKGEKGYDYETGKYFIYKNDTICTGIFEKAGSSYVYEKGKFRAILTSD